MTQIDAAQANLFQGVSQQQPRDRLPGQCTEQINVDPDIVRGLRPRVSTRYIGQLFASAAAPSTFTWASPAIQGTRYKIEFEDGGIRVFTNDGSEVTVNVSADVDTSYLEGGKMVSTVFDSQMFIANKEVTTAMSTSETPQLRTLDKVVQFLGAQYGRVYHFKVKVADDDVINYYYQTPDGSDQEHVHYITSTALSRVFFRALRAGAPNNTRIEPFITTGATAGDPNTAGTYNRAWVDAAIGFNGASITDYTEASIGATAFTNNFTVYWVVGALLIFPDDLEEYWDYDVSVDDGENFTTVNIVGSETTSLATLSRFAAPGMVTKIVGGASDGGDFWMKFVLSATGSLGTNDYVSGTSIAGDPNGTASLDGVQGYPDNDQLYGTAGGSDNAYFNETQASYEFYVYPGRPEWLIVVDTVGDGGIDVVSETVETLNFSDGNETFATLLAAAGPPPEDLLDQSVDFATGDPSIDFGKRGLWVETSAPYEYHRFDQDTMPLILTLNGSTFDLNRGDWLQRNAGDNKTNPVPQFIGKAISDIAIFQGRLCFLADTTWTTSRSLKPLDLWRQSAAILVADDPIGLKTTTSGDDEAPFERMVQHDRDLVIFADGAQFVISGSGPITPTNASMVQTTAYGAKLTARPQSVGANVLFPVQRGGFVGVGEFYVDADTLSNQAREVTTHIPRYVKGNPVQFENSENESTMFVLTDTDKETIYCYNYLWRGQDKVQSAWSKWTFPYEVVHMSFEGSLLYIVVWDGSSYHLIEASFDRQDDVDMGYEFRLDLYEEQASTTTTVTYTAPFADITDVRVIQGDGCPNPGTLAVIQSNVGGTITLRDDMGSGTVYVGTLMPTTWTPTMPLMKDQAGVVIGTGAFTLGDLLLNFADTGHILATISSPYRDDAVIEFDGMFLGSAQAVIGSAGIATGRMVVPVNEESGLSTVSFTSSDIRPFYFTDLEHTGVFIKRGRRITGEG
mgnify:CR=1 FL=1